MKFNDIEKYQQHIEKRLQKLRPIFARVAVGSFPKNISLPDDDQDEFTELYTGIKMMIEVIKEKIDNIESVNYELKLAQKTAKIGNWNWDIKNNEIMWSDELFRIFGISSKKFKPSFQIYLDHIHPEDRKHVEETIDAAYMGKKSFSMYHRIIRPDKSIRILKCNGNVIKNQAGEALTMIGIAQDVTKENTIQKILLDRTKELEEASMYQKLLASIVESSDDAIVSKNLDGVIITWNKGAERIFGYKSKEAVNKHITLIIPKQLHPEEDYILKNIRAGIQIKHFETVRRHKSGRLIDVSITISPIRNNKGEIIGASKIARDITARKIYEQQKEDFVGMVSHELKTPVTSLKMFTHILSQHLKQNNDQPGREYVRRIDEQLDRLTKLVIDLLDVTRVQKGKLEYHKTNFSIIDLVKEITHDLQNASSSHHIIIKNTTVKNVHADKDRIRQVLINLITNAIKYSPDADKVEISFKEDRKLVTVKVKDYGIGIAKDQQKKIFNRFYQVTAPELKSYPGLGLGLYICSEIIEHNGGKISVKSQKNKGSTFSFTLPIAKRQNHKR